MPFEPDQPAGGGRFVPDYKPEGTIGEKPSSTLPANAGVAKLASWVLGMPVDVGTAALNLGIAGAGAATSGLPGKPPDLIKNPVGGSQWLEDKLRGTGMPGLSPDNPTPKDPVGTAQYDFVSRGGPLPGGAIPAAASMAAEAVGGPEWAGVGAMAPSGAVAAFNKARAPGLAKREAQNTVRDATLEDAQKLGFKAPPSQVNPTFVGNRLESVAGKAALNQQAVIENQQVMNAIARRAVGLPENAPLTEQALEAQRAQFSAPYREVSALSSRANLWLEQLKETRFKATAYWRHYDMQADPNSLAAARSLTAKASALEGQIEQEAVKLGKPDLVPRLREARTNIAKTYDVERALNVGDGSVDMRILARALDKGKPLSGELAVAAKFSEAFPQLTRSAAGNPTPGVSALGPMAGAGLGIGGAGAFGPAGAIAGGLPLMRSPMRGMLLSDIYQRNFARPDYTPAMQPENNVQSLVRIAAMANQQGRQ